MDIIPQIVVNSVIAGSIYALVAMSFNLIYGATKFFNLAHGVLAAVGGYIVFLLAKEMDVRLYMAIPVAIIGAGIVGYLLEFLIYRPLRARKASALVLLVASLGAFTALQAVIAIIFTSQFQTLGGLLGPQPTYEILTGVITHIQLLILLTSVLLFGALLFLLKKTSFGKAIRAVNDDEEVARIVGINTNKIIGYTFFIGSAIVGLTGILVGFDTGLEPTIGLSLLLKGVIAAIIGGVGSIPGAFLGAYFLGFAENFGVLYISGEWKDAIAFAVLIVFLLFRPQGIIGSKS